MPVFLAVVLILIVAFSTVFTWVINKWLSLCTVLITFLLLTWVILSGCAPLVIEDTQYIRIQQMNLPDNTSVDIVPYLDTNKVPRFKVLNRAAAKAYKVAKIHRYKTCYYGIWWMNETYQVELMELDFDFDKVIEDLLKELEKKEKPRDESQKFRKGEYNIAIRSSGR